MFLIHCCLSPSDYYLNSTKLCFYPRLYGKTFWLVSFFLYYPNNKFFSIYNYLFRFIFLFGFQWTLCAFALVGPSGLEPPTSCLSGTRSNLLSYDPVWLVWFRTLGVFPFRKFLCLPFFSKKVSGGDDGIRTHDPLLAGQVLSQLSYTPIIKWFVVFLLFSEPRADFSALFSVLALSYLPAQLPVKYCRHCRA